MAYPTGSQYPYQPPTQEMSVAAKVAIACGGGCLTLLLLMVVFVGVTAVLNSGSDPGSGSTAAPTSSPSPTPTQEPSEPTEASDEEPAEDSNEEESDGDESDGESAEENHPGLDETVEHGDWEITVHSIDYGVSTEALDTYFADEPSGQWVVVEMTVTNTGSSPERFSSNDQVLMDDEGSMYRYDLWASDLFGDDLNPGTEGSGALAYDVPEDFEADHMLVNGEGRYSDGVRVDLD